VLLGDATHDARTPIDPQPIPEIIGRYRVQALLGMGGTGAVYAAHDPSLDRPVAIKVPRRSRRTIRDDAASERLIREARALAAIIHPNVVQVYDVGSDASISDAEVFGVYIVMEKLEGTTLRAHMATPRPWRQVVDVFVAAGRGLAAAHAQRLLHRDFKPENVMVTTQGLVKVLDFGLARAIEGVDTTSSLASDDQVEAVEPLRDLTQTGLVMGTPRYMAPEQHAGRKVTQASDQYAFCAAMLEALQGRPVFRGGTVAELYAEKRAFRSRRNEPSGDAPAWLVRILERGLSVQPSERWPSMVRLLDEIERGARSGRRRMTGVGVLTFGAVVTTWWLAPNRDDVCGASARASDLWSPAHAEATRHAFERVDASRGAEAARGLSAALETRTLEWAALQEESCAAYRRGELDARTFDRRMRCFRERRAELEAVIEQLGEADEGLIHTMVEIPSGLVAPDRCIDDEALDTPADAPSGPVARRTASEIDESLARATALLAVHRTARALEEIERASVAAARLGHRPTWLRVAVKHAEALVAFGRFDDAVELIEPVLFECEANGYDHLALEAMHPLLFALVELGRHEDAIERFPQASALADRAQVSKTRRARLLGLQGSVLSASGRLHEARPLFEQAIEIMAEAVGDREPEVQSLLNNYGNLLEKLGEVDAAIAIHHRVLGLRERERGDDHPSLLSPVTNLGAAYLAASRYEEALAAFERARVLSLAHYGPENVKSHHAFIGMGVALKKMGRYEEAIEQYERALAIIESSLGAEHPTAAMLVANIGNAKKWLGRLDEALELHQRALGIRERSLGPDHKDLAMSHHDIANILREQGRLADARLHLEEARRIVEKVFGPDHFEVGTTELLLGLLARDEGDQDAAASHFERSLELRRRARGSEHVSLADPSCHLGTLLRERDLELAAERLERCARLRESASVAPALVGAARLELAKTQWALGHHDDALASAARAISAFEQAVPPDDRLEETKAWLAERARRPSRVRSPR
jgi:eukaryotic-like serine/threonine-protein kinase